MTRKKRELTSDEQKLWRRVAATVKPKSAAAEAAANLSHPPEPEPPTRARETAHHAKAAPAPPSNRAGEKRVRRGKLEIDAAFDLHGHNQQSGRAALKRFLRAAKSRHHRVVIVVTGSGRGGDGVLRRSLPGWLAENDFRELASGYAQAHRSHGGAGAFYVFVRRARTPA